MQPTGREPQQADEFGGLLRRWRTQAGLTQERLAERAGVSVRTIRALEYGQAQPRAETARLLGDALALDGPTRARFDAATRRSHGDPRPALPAAAVRPPAASVVPAQLPADVAGFTGRSQHLRALDALLEAAGDAQEAEDGSQSQAVVISAIAGTAGVGKTALAIHWAHRVRERFADGQLYVNLHGYAPTPPLRPLHALTQLLGALGVAADKVPVEVDQAAGLYRSLLAGRRCWWCWTTSAAPSRSARCCLAAPPAWW